MGPDDYREGLRLVERSAEEWGVEGDVVTYGTLLLAASEQLPPLEALLPSGEGEGEAVRILRLAVAANAVPSESCLNMVMFGLARSGLWEEASAFVEVIEMAGRRVSRNQVMERSLERQSLRAVLFIEVDAFDGYGKVCMGMVYLGVCVCVYIRQVGPVFAVAKGKQKK